MLLSVDQLSVPLPGKSQSKDTVAQNLVSNASFTLKAGEVLAIIGPNGAGKSSLLKALDGQLKFHGRIDMPGISDNPKIRAKQLAVLPQQSLLNFPFSVAEVVELGRIPHATGKLKDQEIISEALQLMDITYLADRNYTQLSGGEKQRVQLARVFSQIWDESTGDNNSRLLLLDEPSSSLDLGHQHHLMRAVKQFAARGVGIIMVMHDINLAARYADTLLALLCSEQIALGSPNHVINQSNMERLFGLSVEVLTSKLNDTPVLIGA